MIDSDWFRKDDDVRWQFGVPPRGNANFALPPLRHSTFKLRHLPRLAPHGIAGFVLVRFWFWVKSKATRALNVLGNPTANSFRERRRETLFIDS